MTARQIIEARLGHKLPPVRDMRPDERRAVKTLAIQLIKAMLQAARIADSHRAMNLNNGLTAAGLACSSVSAFIVQAAREKGLWDESLPQPLIKSNAEMQEAPL